MSTEEKRGTVKKPLLTILMILLLCLIWGNSLLPLRASEHISAFVATFFGVDAEEGAPYIREWVHFVKFCALGLVLTLYLRSRPSDRRSRALALGGGGMFFSLMDETLQMFNGRTASVKDMWMDIAGFALGILLLHLIDFVREFYRVHRKK